MTFLSTLSWFYASTNCDKLSDPYTVFEGARTWHIRSTPCDQVAGKALTNSRRPFFVQCPPVAQDVASSLGLGTTLPRAVPRHLPLRPPCRLSRSHRRAAGSSDTHRA